MSRNRVFEDGRQLTLPVIAGTTSGSPVIVGMIPGVALTNRDAAGNAVVQTDGVITVSVTGAVASVGLPVYITSATYALVVAAGAGIQLFGHARDTKGAGVGNIGSGSRSSPSRSTRRRERGEVMSVKPEDLRGEALARFEVWRSLGLSESSAMRELERDGLLGEPDEFDGMVEVFKTLGLSRGCGPGGGDRT